MAPRLSATWAGARAGARVASAALALVGLAMLALWFARQESPPEPPRADVPSQAPEPSPSSGGEDREEGEEGDGQPRGEVLAASVPTRITIPAIGVASSLETLRLGEGRVMQTPRDPDRAGWYAEGPTPGEQGPSVIAGHVTWGADESVFFRLAELRPGDRIEVRREDGGVAEFTVGRLAQYAKDDFPTVEVYRNLDHAGLRLITCAGARDGGRYADNLVVYAELTGSRPA